jgi:hypothetical protein
MASGGAKICPVCGDFDFSGAGLDATKQHVQECRERVAQQRKEENVEATAISSPPSWGSDDDTSSSSAHSRQEMSVHSGSSADGEKSGPEKTPQTQTLRKDGKNAGGDDAGQNVKTPRDILDIMFRGKDVNWVRQFVCLFLSHGAFMAVCVSVCAIGTFGDAVTGVVFSSIVPFLLLVGGFFMMETRFCTSWAGGALAFISGSAILAIGVTAAVRLALWDVFENSQLVRGAQLEDLPPASSAVAWSFKEDTAKIAFSSKSAVDAGSKMVTDLSCGNEVLLLLTHQTAFRTNI